MKKYLLCLSLTACFSSSHFEKTLGVFGLLLYLFFTFFILMGFYKYLKDLLKLVKKVRPVPSFLIVLFLLITAYSFWYPYENVRGRGTDRDEALNQASAEVLSGHYPYYIKTIVSGRPHESGLDNNPVTVLPGSIFLALPFVLLGNSTFQNFFWIVILFLFLSKYYNSYSYSFLFIAVNLAICATFLFQIMIGSDYIANSIWILVSSALFLKYSGVFNPKSMMAGLIFGFCLSSRLNFLIILIPISLNILSTTDLWNTIKQVGFVLLGFCLITIPFLLYDPSNFTPLFYSNFYSGYDKILPVSSITGPFINIILIGSSSFVLYKRTSQIFLIISIYLLIPVIFLVVLNSVNWGRISFELSHYAFASFIFMSFYVFEKIRVAAYDIIGIPGR